MNSVTKKPNEDEANMKKPLFVTVNPPSSLWFLDVPGSATSVRRSSGRSTSSMAWSLDVDCLGYIW